MSSLALRWLDATAEAEVAFRAAIDGGYDIARNENVSMKAFGRSRES